VVQVKALACELPYETGIPLSRFSYREIATEAVRRVLWVVDNGSSQRGAASIGPMRSRWPNAKLVHLLVHASWLNQMEIYFGIVQKKVLTPNDFVSLGGVAQRLKELERHHERVANPFEWKFTREDLSQVLRKLREDAEQSRLTA
jgi:hypothetical protein